MFTKLLVATVSLLWEAVTAMAAGLTMAEVPMAAVVAITAAMAMEVAVS